MSMEVADVLTVDCNLYIKSRC